MNRVLQERADEYPKDFRSARIRIFKRKELFVSRQERRGSRVSTFVDTVPELVEEVNRIRSELREEGIFVIVELSPTLSQDMDSPPWRILSDDERKEFMIRYMRARG